MQEVYDKKVLHRLVGVPPKTVKQDDPQLSGIVHLKGGGASIVQSAWEPAERSPETDDEGHTRKRKSSTMTLSREVIDVDADESRYDIPLRKRRKMKEVIDAGTIFTTDEGSEGEVIVVGSSEEGEGSDGGEEEDGKRGRVKINRKRAFWASKAGTAAGLGT